MITSTRRTVLAGLAGTLAAPHVARAQASPRTSYTLRIDRDVEQLDPAFRSSPQDGSVIWAVFQKLAKFLPGTTEWRLDAASDLRQVSDTVVEFTLRPGLMFSDGYGEMTAEDVKFSFERIGLSSGENLSPYRADWSNLERVEVTGTHTGRIVMRKPTAHLWRIGILDGSGSIVSRKAIQAMGLGARQKPVGTGPYEMTQFEPKRQVLLRLRPDWAGPAPVFRDIAIRYVPDPKTAELAYRAGEIDFTELTPAVANALRTAPETVVAERPGLRFVWISLNTEKKPLDDPRVRRAIRMGLDVDQMLLAGYQGKAPRARALIQPAVTGHWPDAPAHKRDVAGAKRLLAEAGVAPGLRLKLTLLNQPAYQAMALVARSQLAEIGITIEVDARDGGSYWSSGKGDAGKSLDLVIQRFNGKLDPNFNTQWYRSDQVGVWNWARWASPEFDALDEQAAATLDEAARAALVIRMQQLMEESAAFVWLTYDVDIFAHRSWLKPAIMPTGSDWQLADFTQA